MDRKGGGAETKMKYDWKQRLFALGLLLMSLTGTDRFACDWWLIIDAEKCWRIFWRGDDAEAEMEGEK